MTERIDHVARSLGQLNAGHQAVSSETRKLNIAEAQVNATLALVEQQRIANLIAMSALNFRDADFTKLWNAEGDTAEWRAVRDQVAVGLGLS